jgi:FtsH-binding integral membrane protein
MTAASARSAFFAFSAVMGVSMAAIFLAYTETSIARTFFIAASMFLGVSLWGYTTKKDLTGWTTFLFMGLIGVVVASIVNVFLGSTTLQLVVSFAGIIVFTGLTAWDTQRAKSDYLAFAGTEHAEKLGIMGALSLYLNFVNLFQLLLTFFGQREE